MRIVFVSPFPPARDGIGTYSQMMIAALRAVGHEAVVVLPHAQKTPTEDVIGVLSPRQSNLASLTEVVTKWNPDIIHVQFAFAAFGIRTRVLCSWLRSMRIATGVPVVATMHEVTREIAALRGPGRALYRMLARQCDRVIVHTRIAHAALTGPVCVPEAKGNVIPHPEATPPRAVSAPADLRVRFGLGDAELLVAFGFVHVDKGLGDLVRALDSLRRSGACGLGGVRLVIAGTVRPRHGLFVLFGLRDRLHFARVLRMARHAKVRENIVLTGYVPEADVSGWFKAAAAVVLPYRRTEQSGVAALANAFGVPVLASTAGGLGEQYGSSGWTFPPRDPKELADVLGRFLTMPPSERAVNVNRRSAADIDSVVEATIDLYEAAVGPRMISSRVVSQTNASSTVSSCVAQSAMQT
jgi:glycosyltransferase involved in cell wall biosynthesis